MRDRFDLDKTYYYLLLVLAFLMPLTVALANTVIVIICLLWLFSGNYSLKFNQILSSKLLVASIIFYFIHIVGMLWTDDVAWGLHMLHKMWYFLLLLPVLFSIMKKQYIRNIIIAFLLAIGLTELISYLIWFEVIAPFKNATINNPTPFMSHVSYNPILAFAIYIVAHEVFFNKKLSKTKFFLYSFFLISMSFNMFITGGRAGQIMFFASLAILIFQYFNEEKIKSLLAISILLPGIFFTAYSSSDLFKDRVDSALQDIIRYEGVNVDKDSWNNKETIFNLASVNTPVGERISYAVYSWKIFSESPIIGVGTGDFPIEYKKLNAVYSPKMVTTHHPHNMYSLVSVQLGLVGLISLLTIFYYQIKQSLKSSNRFMRDTGITLPLMYLLIMFSDSYLLGHYTTLMFVLFSAFLYKDFEKT